MFGIEQKEAAAAQTAASGRLSRTVIGLVEGAEKALISELASGCGKGRAFGAVALLAAVMMMTLVPAPKNLC